MSGHEDKRPGEIGEGFVLGKAYLLCRELLGLAIV
jgi:hypothetical protein